MRLGFAVKVLGGGGLPSHDSRRWPSNPHLRVSLSRLRAIFDYLETVKIDMYRMSPSLAPYATHPELPQFRGQVEECSEDLTEVGTQARAACGSRATRASTSSSTRRTSM
jgi:UV DNA damage endonuclease